MARSWFNLDHPQIIAYPHDHCQPRKCGLCDIFRGTLAFTSSFTPHPRAPDSANMHAQCSMRLRARARAPSSGWAARDAHGLTSEYRTEKCTETIVDSAHLWLRLRHFAPLRSLDEILQ